MKGNVFEDNSWNKLWKKDLLNDFRFPVGMIFEDIATTWKLLLKCKRVVTVPDILIHHVVRKNSLGNTKTMKNLADRWIAFKERYDAMSGRNEELRQICTKGCLNTIGYTWRWLFIIEDRDEEKLQEMREFLRNNWSSVSYCSIQTRISLFCALYSNRFTNASCFYLNQIYRRFNRFEGM